MERNRPTDLLAIRNWYEDDEVELTQHQEVKKNRYLMISSLLSAGKPNHYILRVLKKNFDISPAQSYRDIRDSISLYGNLRKAEKEGMRWIIYDLMAETRLDARSVGDYRAAAAVESNMMKIMGADRDDPEMPDFENLQPSLNIVVIDPAAEKQMLELLKAGPIDFDQISKRKQIVEDVEHEDVSDSGGEAGAGDQSSD